MTPQTQELLRRFPVRKSRVQKAQFRQWLLEVLGEAGYAVSVEESGSLIRSANVVAGEAAGARVLFTAHYDTPARLPWPNLICPHNLLITLLLQLPLVAVMLAAVFAVEVGVIALTDSSLAGILAGYLLLVGVVWLMLAGPANPSNVNDNTSGVITLMETALSLPPEHRAGVAFVFFDNEEKGLVGSAAFKKRHMGELADTLVVNFDCVSDGDHLRLFPGKGAKRREDLLAALERCYRPEGDKQVEVARGWGMYPSDQLHFPLGVGAAAFRRSKLAGYWLGRIHTPRDTVLQEENIALLRRGSLALAAEMSRGEACSPAERA